jgi:predicted Rossmann fold flavoprotein
MKNYDVIVIGAGAAGLIAAGRAAEQGSKVLLLDKMERAGRKLLITGKGRCNITNDASPAEFFKHIFPNSRFLKHAFATFFSKDIVNLIEIYGVKTVVERGGRVFPESNKSADVVDALLKYCNKNHVEIRCRHKVEKLLIENDIIKGVSVSSNGKIEDISGASVIVCTGGCSYPATGSDGDGYKMARETGHELVSVRQSLVPVETKGDIASRLQGLSLKNVNASVWVNGKKVQEEFGEMLFTHFGLTGPIILTLSRLMVDELRNKNKVEVSIDLKPALDENKLDDRLIRDLNENGKKQFDNIFKLWLPSKLIPVFLTELNIESNKQCHQVNAKERRKIMLYMKNFRFEVTGYRSFKEAIITAGGIDLKDIDPKTMESKKVKNLYFAGEVLNLDANTGGFNLQIAFSTGWLAGQSASRNNSQV